MISSPTDDRMTDRDDSLTVFSQIAAIATRESHRLMLTELEMRLVTGAKRDDLILIGRLERSSLGTIWEQQTQGLLGLAFFPLYLSSSQKRGKGPFLRKTGREI